MRLKLVLKGPERLMRAQTVKTMDEGSMVVGRAPEADWVLPDPNRVVSKAHCKIEKDFSGFVLTDTSTNGVHVNDEPVRFGLPRLLCDGDVLRLGDAVVVARIESGPTSRQPADAPQAIQPRLISVAASIPNGPFGQTATIVSAAAPATPQRVPPAAFPPSGDVLDDWWRSETSDGPAASPKTGDILPQTQEVEIAHINGRDSALTSSRGDVASLISSMADVDPMTLARAVDAALCTFSESERGKFGERLRGILNGG
jgi:predicted component of type VI protein secretion system